MLKFQVERKDQTNNFQDIKKLYVAPASKAVGESRVPVSRPKASSPGRKKLLLDTRKYKIFALFMWKLELPMIWDFPYSCRNYLANHRAPYLACGDRDISG